MAFGRKDKGGGGGFGLGNMGGMMQQAQDAMKMAQAYQANPDMYAQNAMQAMQGMQGTATGNWINDVLHPQADFVRHCVCDNCGGQKRRPSPTAYLYCDYCSALVDFDFRKLVSDPMAMPDPSYGPTVNGIGEQSRSAIAAGDRNLHHQLQTQLFEAMATYMPQQVSHRVKDPTYRASAAWVFAATATAIAFDPQAQALDAQMRQAVLACRWNGMQVDPDSFWPLLDIVIRQQQYGAQVVEAAGIPDNDPDRASKKVRDRMGLSVMVQGWLTSLSAEAGEQMIERCGLAGDYRRFEPMNTEARHCGKCGSEFAALPGATYAICDACGHRLDVGSAEFPCSHCGGGITMPSDVANINCPYCKGYIERMGR